ncbi:Na+/H+ antiporter subunit E [Pontibacter anaerobius]|uniref:Na+/H+ antiporter subunit E n=1 Tax=Pontibacter anaerobius TaxID=2993940 RepID=A0ABT3RK42_9BACT|nr:Na+/H+ antiporter subunit E [Pontibacter anaerobius]MCX2741858.1 Na+/H+ antiporter subunit E [Pontibacter anaerobius]
MKLLLIHSLIAGVAVYFYFQHPDAIIPYTALSTALLFLVLFSLLWNSSYFYHRSYYRKMPKLLHFIMFFMKELFVANMKIAYDIITPHYHMSPTVLAFPLRLKTDLEISILANMIGLTPGTLSIDVSADRKFLYVHTLYLKHKDIEQLKLHIKNGFERRILELTA